METGNFNDFIEKNWENIIETLRNEYDIADISFDTWIRPLKFKNIEDDVVYIIVPTDMAQAMNYISKKFMTYFMVTITEMIDHNVKVMFILENDVQNEEITKKEKIYNINSENANLVSKYRFDTFVVGNSNKFAHSAALAVAESPGEAYNPLFLYGGSGLGKTHLMHSIGHFILDQDPNKKVLYVTAENFTNEVINAIRSNSSSKVNEIRKKYRSVDVLLVDDVQYIIGKEATQQEFFNTFNELHSAGKQIIISSDKPPQDMETLEERFRTRFQWGLTADIQAPDYETRMAILNKYSENNKKDIDNAVFEYIAENITSNIRELEGAYNKLMAYSRLNKVDITLDVAEEALKDIINPNQVKEITPANIINIVAEHFNLTADDIRSKRKTADLVLPRQICMYLCKELTQEPLQEIAKALNKKDHTTIIYGINKISESVKVDKSLSNKIDILKKKISPL
ncbi:MAG: chromosomal replication initiator protein DnaA [Lachnospiraceae bacterium]|nr:chromosomal replication initiator protein DnaA [Lachnospiraceae bacterium]